jgi:hypothetical protein
MTCADTVIYSPGNDQLYTLDHRGGWLSRRGADGVSRRMCWLPHERRYKAKIASLGDRVCIGADSGAVTILDFSASKDI